MLLSVVLLISAVQPAPPPQASSPPSAPVAPWVSDMMEARTRCGPNAATPVADNIRAQVQRLGDLPPANHTLTVLRSVDGCPVSSTVRYNVDIKPRSPR